MVAVGAVMPEGEVHAAEGGSRVQFEVAYSKAAGGVAGSVGGVRVVQCAGGGLGGSPV